MCSVTDIQAVIFDMDGLLIDTEPIWRRAEIDIFGSLGLHLSEEQCMETMGVRVPEVVALWYRRHPWNDASVEQVTERIIQAVIAHVEAEGEPMAGVCDALETVRRAGLPIAIASSSSIALIDAVVRRLGIAHYISVRCSAEDEAEGKPHPAVYLRAAECLNASPNRCVALEDSPNGVLAARAAGMICIAVPDRHLAGDPRFRQADIRLPTLEDFTPDFLARLSSLTLHQGRPAGVPQGGE